MSLTTTTTVYKDDVHVIPATDLNTWRTELPKALDGAAGGSYTPAAAINIFGAGLGHVIVRTKCEVAVGGQWVEALGADVADTDGQTFTLAQGQVRQVATPTAQRDHALSTVGAIPGSWIHFIRPSTGNFAIILHRTLGGGAIVTLPNLTWSTATVYFDDSGVWRLLCTDGGTPGADA